MNVYLDNYWYLLLLLLVPVAGWLLYRFISWRKKKRAAFAESRFREDLFGSGHRFSGLFPMLYLGALSFLILALMDPLGGSEEIKTQQKLNNVIYLLDVSNSMNAEDLEPNRLSQAKNIMLNSLQNLTNDRVGVVVFAGDATSVMPLTTDYTAAETYIEGLETSVIKIQGTDFGAAMKTAVQKFKNVPKGARQVVLLSDGEDNEGNDDAAARLAEKEGITITAVGIGGDEGAPVPEYIYGQLMGYKIDASGQTVISKRQEKALRNLASRTGGEYIDGNNMENAVKEVNGALAGRTSGTSVYVKSQNATHYFQYFLAVSVLLFALLYLFNPKRDLNI